ncbi:MBL fold metallo-hydrolase [Rhodococcus sp. NPDC057014]|uniref:MBL fold metallo-hydrolase n=1 Tax=Rhodococcus sp. NPDC057014 TaxID=3346000 RepID=UPI003640B735
MSEASPNGSGVNALVYTSSWPTLPGGGTFSPTTSTLITGPTEAVLVDAQYLIDDVRKLGDLIESTGKKLTTIYVTHGHADHYLGLGPLLKRFPGARCVATPEVIEYMTATMDRQKYQWNSWFGEKCVDFGPLPEPLDGTTLYADKSPLEIVEVGQADISPTTVVHVPEIATVIAGDAVYNQIHAMLALTTPDEWNDWIATIDKIEQLRPEVVVAGHKKPDADDRPARVLMDTTRQYIRDFAEAVRAAETKEQVVKRMTWLYPDHGNLWTLQYSAHAYFEHART